MMTDEKTQGWVESRTAKIWSVQTCRGERNDVLFRANLLGENQYGRWWLFWRKFCNGKRWRIYPACREVDPHRQIETDITFRDNAMHASGMGIICSDAGRDFASSVPVRASWCGTLGCQDWSCRPGRSKGAAFSSSLGILRSGWAARQHRVSKCWRLFQKYFAEHGQPKSLPDAASPKRCDRLWLGRLLMKKCKLWYGKLWWLTKWALNAGRVLVALGIV